MVTQQDLPLPAQAPSGSFVVAARCTVRAEDELRVVLVAGVRLCHYNADDAVAEAFATVSLVEPGYATQEEVARAFGRSVRTVRRHQGRYSDGGMTALATRPGGARGADAFPPQQLGRVLGLDRAAEVKTIRRKLTRLASDGKAEQLGAELVRLFERWRQENFFKYLREEFLLDALADHQVEEDGPPRTVPNP
jgi:hypothetical protein